MWGYLLKRLLLILPTVWLISSLIFLLSRIIPGSYTDLLIETEQTTIGGADVQLNRKSYLKQLKESSQDLPLVYFSVRSRAQPDTLNRVFPVPHQYLLQQLLNRYGNWPAVTAYYKSLLNLQAAAVGNGQQINEPDVAASPEEVQFLLQTAEPETIKQLIQEIKAVPGLPESSVKKVQDAFTQMQQQAKPVNLLIPSFRWHGRNNQYHQWLLNLVAGDMGYSYRFQQPVIVVIGEAIGNTLLLLAGSLLLTFALSIRLALVLCRWRHGQSLVLNTLYIIDSTPLFLMALLLLTFLAGYLNIFPVFGLGEEEDPAAGLGQLILTQLHHLLLPALCLVITSVPYVTSQLYQVLQQVLATPFITTARAKGLTETQVLQTHAYRNALLPLITLFTGYLPAIVSGAVVIEVIFAIPGTGSLLVASVLERDYPVILGLVLFISALQAISHVLADFLYFMADPRTRLKLA